MSSLQKLLLAVAFILIPASGWYVAPRLAIMAAGACEAQTVNVFVEKDRSVVTRANWWFSPGFWRGNGTYHAEIVFREDDGKETIRHVDRTYELRYVFRGDFIQAETLRVAPLREENRAGRDLDPYIDPIVKEGFSAPAFIFTLPGKNVMVGLNKMPRTLCLTPGKR